MAARWFVAAGIGCILAVAAAVTSKLASPSRPLPVAPANAAARGAAIRSDEGETHLLARRLTGQVVDAESLAPLSGAGAVAFVTPEPSRGPDADDVPQVDLPLDSEGRFG